MVILQDPSGCQYNFDMLDNVFDFMSAHHMIPYLDLGQRPFCAVKSEGQMVYYEDEELVSAADLMRRHRRKNGFGLAALASVLALAGILCARLAFYVMELSVGLAC